MAKSVVMMTDEEADIHLSRLCRLREVYYRKKAELRAQERRANPSLRDLKEADREYFLVKLVFEKTCVETNRSEIPEHIWEKYFRP